MRRSDSDIAIQCTIEYKTRDEGLNKRFESQRDTYSSFGKGDREICSFPSVPCPR